MSEEVKQNEEVDAPKQGMKRAPSDDADANKETVGTRYIWKLGVPAVSDLSYCRACDQEGRY